ncbi:MAG: alpha/beta hydrolase [Planctomycetota bacterium]
MLQLRLCLPFVLPFSLGFAAFLIHPAPPLCAAVLTADPEPARVTLAAEDKSTLVGTYFAPCDTKQKAAAALLLHDTGGSRADVLALAKRLQKSGFAVLTLDLRGHGESATAEVSWKALDSDGQLRAWTAMQGDMKTAVTFLTTQTGVQPSRVSLLAQGNSAMLAVRHAVRDERVRDLVLIDPKPEVHGNSIVKDLEQLGGLPTLIVVGKDDQNTGKRLIEASSKSATSSDWIEVRSSKQDAAAIMTDKSMYGDVSKWMLEKSLPAKAKG